ncbi:MAG TPA: hypothetical protein VKC66_08730 [Xanthobacteraceae bacterium]|nr:hypothetical protein [Xanthobacteraceae bacterium]
MPSAKKTKSGCERSCYDEGYMVRSPLNLGQISMRKVDGWQALAIKPLDQPFDLAT